MRGGAGRSVRGASMSRPSSVVAGMFRDGHARGQPGRADAADQRKFCAMSASIRSSRRGRWPRSPAAGRGDLLVEQSRHERAPLLERGISKPVSDVPVAGCGR